MATFIETVTQTGLDIAQDLIDQGLIDGYQPDIVSHGFAGWMEVERQLEGTGVKSVPHNFGNGRYGARASVVFGAASKTFVSHEDERQRDHTYRTNGLSFEDGGYRVGDFHDHPVGSVQVDEPSQSELVR